MKILKTPFNRWYDRNRETFNAERRERYQRDQMFRHKALQNNTKYHKGATYKRRQWINRHRIEINGIYVLAYSISEVAAILGRSTANIRYWERRGYIGDAKRGRGQRKYTQDNIILLKRLDRLMRNPGSKKRRRKIITVIKQKWK